MLYAYLTILHNILISYLAAFLQPHTAVQFTSRKKNYLINTIGRPDILNRKELNEIFV